MSDAHSRAQRTWHAPHAYRSRTWAVRYLDSCQQHSATELQALQATRYLATPWFSYQRIQLHDAASAAHDDHAAQLLALHADMLRRFQHLVRWLSPLERHLTHHRHRVERFSIMCCLWQTDRVRRDLVAPPPKRRCGHRPKLPGTRSASPTPARPKRPRTVSALDVLWGVSEGIVT